MAEQIFGHDQPTADTIVYQSVEDIRANFLDFFAEKGYEITPGAGVLPDADPTLMFINSGMAAMKPYFTGAAKPPAERIANSQQCIRTVDLPDVGDSHHGTSFRMLGSWMFNGAFSKGAAIDEAWEFLTERLRIPASRMLATYLDVSGVNVEGLTTDDESYSLWQKHMAGDRIIGCPPEDNFWGPAGETGPCGPCTETFFDRGVDFGQAEDGELVTGRHIEIWNAGVFMEQEKMADGSIVPLSHRSVDTGAGLDRLALILQNVPSMYEIDQHAPGFNHVRSILPDEISARIVYDHFKTANILINSGIQPGNKREAYILRRLLRRAFSQLHVADISLDTVPELMDAVQGSVDVTPGAVVDAAENRAVLHGEVQSFERVLRSAKKHLTSITSEGAVDVGTVMNLKSTYGIPEDLVRAHCEKNGIAFPKDEIEALQSKSSSVH